MVTAKDLIKFATDTIRSQEITKIYLITDFSDVVDPLCKEAGSIPVWIHVMNKGLFDKLSERKEEEGLENIEVRRIRDSELFGLNLLSDCREILTEDLMGGKISMEDRVLVLIYSSIRCVLYFKVKNVGIAYILSETSNQVNEKVLESVLSLSLEIAREGREGRQIGALFVVGDSDEVLKYSRQVIINPFKGHPKESRNVLNREHWETFKEFAQLDGAIVINDEGIARAAGRYVGINWDIYLQGGLGGRHLAAASISKMTDAIAVTVSASNVIRVFYKGRVIFKATVI